MTAKFTIELPFAPGSKVWRAGMKPDTETRPCPVCSGKRVITVILGDDTRVTVDCDGCRRGYLGPDGRNRHWCPIPDVQEVTLGAFYRMDDGEAWYYEPGQTSGTILSSSTLFRTREEAEECAKALCEERERNTDRHNAISRSRRGGKDAPDMLAYYLGRKRELVDELARIERWLHCEPEIAGEEGVETAGTPSNAGESGASDEPGHLPTAAPAIERCGCALHPDTPHCDRFAKRGDLTIACHGVDAHIAGCPLNDLEVTP